MYFRLAFRHLLVRPGRALVLLVGYAVGVAVMIVLLSVGDAMLDQSRDPALVGGGDVTVLPQGVDLEAMRSGGLTGMFHGIDGARFVAREMIGGPRHAGEVAAVSPVLEQKLLDLRTRDTTFSVRAGADLPSAARQAGAPLHLIAGMWESDSGDHAWIAPGAQALYDQIDHFHRPPGHDSSWAEWHYFNVVVSVREWWYVTLLVGGDLNGGRAGGQVLVTHRVPDGSYRRFTAGAAQESVHFDTTRADVTVGPASVEQRDGSYHVAGRAGAARFDFTLSPAPHAYFPPVELGGGSDPSGYVVPGVIARASGVFCTGDQCRSFDDAVAYHDHNWGSWRAVTWEWGTGRGSTLALLYGGIVNDDRRHGSVPFFLAIEDSLGLRQVYRFESVERSGHRSVPGTPDISAPDSLNVTATRLGDTLHLVVGIIDAAASPSRAAGPQRVFLQMRGRWWLRGTAAGVPVADSGTGFFETWMRSTLQGPLFPMRAHVRHP